MLIEFLAEGLALSRALAQDLQSSFGRPEGPHAVMDPARPQPALSYLKPPALTWAVFPLAHPLRMREEPSLMHWD